MAASNLRSATLAFLVLLMVLGPAAGARATDSGSDGADSLGFGADQGDHVFGDAAVIASRMASPPTSPIRFQRRPGSCCGVLRQGIILDVEAPDGDLAVMVAVSSFVTTMACDRPKEGSIDTLCGDCHIFSTRYLHRVA